MKPLALLPTLALASLLPACGGMKIALQDPVASAPAIVIEGKGKVLTMGGVTIERTKGGGVTKFSGKAGPWGGEKIKQNFEFSTSDGWTGACAFASGGQSIAGFEIASNGGLMCTITKGEVSWALNLQAVQDDGKRLVGTYSGGGATIDVRMSLELEGSGFPIFIGYTYASSGTGVAAVQSSGTRQLWLVDGTPDAEAIKASVGALIFSYMAVQQATQ